MLLIALVSTFSLFVATGPQLGGGLTHSLKMRPGKAISAITQPVHGTSLLEPEQVPPEPVPSLGDQGVERISSPPNQEIPGRQDAVSNGDHTNAPEIRSAGFTHPLKAQPETLPPQELLYPASQPPLVLDPSEQELRSFAAGIGNGDGGRLAGLFVRNRPGFPVVQQPPRSPAFVSSEAQVVTQFGLASQYGSIGLLAHNSYAGSDFHHLQAGQEIYLVYGDGTMVRYRVYAVRRFQALSPKSLQSDFLDLDNGNQRLTALELFNQVYRQSDRLVLQTCIASEGTGAWGRLFVIALPVERSAGELALSP